MIKTHPVSVACGSYALAGNLVLPEGAAQGAAVPGAVILGGPGPVPLTRYTEEGLNQWPILWSEALGKAGLGALCYDQRGSGLSTGLYHEADWQDLYEDCKAAAEMLEIQPEISRTAAVAWGEGCGFALRLAAEGQVSALVLLAPAYHNAEQRYEADIARLAASKGLSDRVVQIRVNQWKSDMTNVIRKVEQGVVHTTTDVGGKTVTTNLVRFLQTTAFDPSQVVPAVKVPVLLLHGEDDTVVHPDESEAMQQALPGQAERKTYPGAAHFLYRNPQVIADAVAWLKGTLA